MIVEVNLLNWVMSLALREIEGGRKMVAIKMLVKMYGVPLKTAKYTVDALVAGCKMYAHSEFFGVTVLWVPLPKNTSVDDIVAYEFD